MEVNQINLDIAKLAIEALKGLAWPALVFLLVVIYHKPLRKVIESLSLKLYEAKKVSLGNLSLEIQERARELGNPDLAKQVGALSPLAVEELLRTQRDGQMILLSTYESQGKKEYGLPAPESMRALVELQQKNFIYFQEDLDMFLHDLRRLARSDTHGSSERIWYISASPDPLLDNRLTSQGYHLTESGKKAANAILKAVVAQLSQDHSTQQVLPEDRAIRPAPEA